MTAASASDQINSALDAAAMAAREAETPRDYLGASAIGHDCLRRIQWDWRSPQRFEGRTLDIFERGHWVEAHTWTRMHAAGFRMVRGSDPRITFSQLGSRFRGHGDGMITAGPEIEGLGYPCLWENKGLGSRGWTKLVKDGLAKAYPGYADQLALYMAYFDLTTHPALFTATNMDTMERKHLLVPFDAARAQRVSDRAVTVVQADEAGETLARVTDNPDDFRCRFCPHRERCWA